MPERITIRKISVSLMIPIGIFLVLTPDSWFIGWNIVSILLFWFLIVPGMTSYLPVWLNNEWDHYFESFLGLILFYGVMILLIYDHYQSDYFKLMLISGLLNLFSVSAVIWKRSLDWKLK